MNENKKCVLYDRDCIDCGECDRCDLDPDKICDNCGKCIDSGNDYNTVDVDLIQNENTPKNYTDSDFFGIDKPDGEYDDDDYDDYNDDDDYDDDYDDYDDGYDDNDDYNDYDDQDPDAEDSRSFNFGFGSDFGDLFQ